MSEPTRSESEIMAHTSGIPIYADKVRQLLDSASELQPNNWQPANVAAQKLYRCVESLRDVDELLKSAGRSINTAKRRRKLKIMLTPLHTLAESCRDLLNDLECNPDTVQSLPEGVRELLPHMRAQLLGNVAIGKGGLLSTARNKISAHIDKDLSAEDMGLLLSKAEPSQIGFWLHNCVAIISDLIKVPVFFWSCAADRPDAIRILFNEPFVVTLGIASDGKVHSLLGVDIIPRPPRYDVHEILRRVVANSKWMFRPKDTRIGGFTVDGPKSPWPRSLERLPNTVNSSNEFRFTTNSSVAPNPFSNDGRVLLIPMNVPFFAKVPINLGS